MSTEKMREEFNRWYDKDRKKAAPFSTVNIRDKCFEAWQASRAAIEVELPPIGDYIDRYGQGNNCDEYVDMVKDAIESLGLKVKPC